MRLAAERFPGRPKNRSERVYGVAAMWPRSRNRPGGNVAAAGANRRQRASDLEDVRNCMLKERDHEVTVFDVALECHMSDKHAERLMRKVKSCDQKAT
jgi:hypothetical protein